MKIVLLHKAEDPIVPPRIPGVFLLLLLKAVFTRWTPLRRGMHDVTGREREWESPSSTPCSHGVGRVAEIREGCQCCQMSFSGHVVTGCSSAGEVRPEIVARRRRHVSSAAKKAGIVCAAWTNRPRSLQWRSQRCAGHSSAACPSCLRAEV